MAKSELNGLDFIVLAGYFLSVLAVGFWSMMKNRKRGTVTGYFLANKNMPWYAIGASLFASNIGSGHFVGLAGSAAANGVAVISYELNGMLVILICGYFFIPIYLSSKCKTMPEYLKLRFGGSRITTLIATISMLIYVFTKISVDIYAGAI